MEDTGYEIFSYYYDALTENVDYQARARYFDRLIQKNLQSDGNVMLDLACGTGTMTEQMAKLGYDMIGIDYSAGMLSRAMEKKIAENLPILYVQQDMRELELYGTVDATICTLDSLNHLRNWSEVENVMQRIWQVTEPGGLLVFDMNTLYKHQVLLRNEVYVYETEDVYCVWENVLKDDDCTVDIILQLFQCCEDGRYTRTEEHLTERAYSVDQVADGLKRAGFQLLGIYAADTEEPLQEKSERMVVVARKEREVWEH